MSLTIDHSRLYKTPTGYRYQGFGTFTTTGTTVEVAVPFGRITSFTLTPVGTPTVDEVLSVDETVANDVMARPTGGTVTVTRAAGTTSNLKFAFSFEGY
jgi:hypothetical protein